MSPKLSESARRDALRIAGNVLKEMLPDPTVYWKNVPPDDKVKIIDQFFEALQNGGKTIADKIDREEAGEILMAKLQTLRAGILKAERRSRQA